MKAFYFVAYEWWTVGMPGSVRTENRVIDMHPLDFLAKCRAADDELTSRGGQHHRSQQFRILWWTTVSEEEYNRFKEWL